MYQASKCEELKLWAKNATELPESLGRLTGLKKLYLWGCGRLERLPDSMSQLVALKELTLYCCYSLVGTVELRSGVQVIGEPDGLTVTYKKTAAEKAAEKAAAQKAAAAASRKLRRTSDN
jgi:hypothetical protein